MANEVSVLISAKDEASKIIAGTAENFRDATKKIGVGFAGVSVALGVYEKKSVDFVGSMVSQAKALSRQTGETIENSSKLAYVMEKLGGGAEGAESKFNAFTKQIADVRDKSGDVALQQEQLRQKIDAANISIAEYTKQAKEQGDTSGKLANKIQGLRLDIREYKKSLDDTASPLERLKVATQNADGSNRSFNDILLDVADRFKSMPDGIDKTKASLDLFGRSGADMIKVLNLGSDGIRDMEQKAGDLGLTLNAKTIGAVSKYIQSTKDLKEVQDGLKVTVGTLTAESMTSFNKTLLGVTQSLIGTDSPFRGAIANVLAYGGPVAAATSATLEFVATGGEAAPMLLGLARYLTNPMFIIFSLAVAGASLAFAQFVKDSGGVNKAMGKVQETVTKLAKEAGDYLMPKLQTLGAIITDDLAPAALKLWHDVLEPLAPVIGQVLVVAAGLLIDSLSLVVSSITTIVNAVTDGSPVILGLVGVFGTIAAAMAIQSGVSAFNTAMETVTKRYAVFSTLVASPVVMPAIAIGAAIAAIAEVVKSYNEMKDAINQANDSQKAFAKQSNDVYAQQTAILNDKVSSPARKAQARKILDSLQQSQQTTSGLQIGDAFKLSPTIAGRASGGPMAAGVEYMINERGQESIKLSSGGWATPAHESKGMAGVTINGGVHLHNELDQTMFLRSLAYQMRAA